MKKTLLISFIALTLLFSACGAAEEPAVTDGSDDSAAEVIPAPQPAEEAAATEAEPEPEPLDISALTYDELEQYRDDPQVLEQWSACHDYLEAFRWQALDSSALLEAGYSWLWQALAVRFVSSPERVYVYQGVPEEVFAELISADSAGGYYNAYIKGSYECEKLE